MIIDVAIRGVAHLARALVSKTRGRGFESLHPCHVQHDIIKGRVKMRQIDGKYKTSGDITKLDGTPISEDEPLILFRGQDKLLVPLLDHYLELCRGAGSPGGQIKLLRERIAEVKTWQDSHPDRLKVPD